MESSGEYVVLCDEDKQQLHPQENKGKPLVLVEEGKIFGVVSAGKLIVFALFVLFGIIWAVYNNYSVTNYEILPSYGDSDHLTPADQRPSKTVQVDGANNSTGQLVPCLFIFGDSIADDGNNNNRATVSKANFLPYGIDFPEGPTGRFTNNRTLFDVLTQLLGFDDFIPPFANLSGQDILKGVNYASAAAGILDITGRLNQGDIISLNGQLSNHLTTVAAINLILGSETSAKDYLSQCIYTVDMGSNDYINNYFLPDTYPTSYVFTPEEFANLLVTHLNLQLMTLYSLGARKVAVFGLGLLGSCPGVIASLGANASAVTNASQLFTNKLPDLVNTLNTQLPDANFTYINTTGITLTTPASTLNVTGTCCEVVDVLYTCAEGVPPCSNRDEYAFFDGFHTTDVVNEAQAQRVFTSELPTDAIPYDISTLAGI